MFRRFVFLGWIGAGPLLAAGCGDGDRVAVSGQPTAAPAPGSDGNADPPPLYVVSTGLSTETEFVGYLTTATSLDAGATFDLGRAAEIGAGAWIFNRPG